MAQPSHSLALDKRKSSEAVVRASELSLKVQNEVVRKDEMVVRASELLRNFGIPAKNFALGLMPQVSERYVQLMANGEKPIQGWMVKQIIEIGETLLWEQKRAIENYIQRALKAQYGRSE